MNIEPWIIDSMEEQEPELEPCYIPAPPPYEPDHETDHEAAEPETWRGVLIIPMSP